LKTIVPKFDFSETTPAVGDGQNHEEGEVTSLDSSVFNEYERVLSQIAIAIGDYSVTDTIPSSDETLAGSLKWAYDWFTNAKWPIDNTVFSGVVEYSGNTELVYHVQLHSDSARHDVGFLNIGCSQSSEPVLSPFVRYSEVEGLDPEIAFYSSGEIVVRISLNDGEEDQHTSLKPHVHLLYSADQVPPTTLFSIGLSSYSDPYGISIDIGEYNTNDMVHIGANAHGIYGTQHWGINGFGFHGPLIGSVTREGESRLDSQSNVRHLFGFVDSYDDSLSVPMYVRMDDVVVIDDSISPLSGEVLDIPSDIYVSGELTVGVLNDSQYVVSDNILYDQTMLCNSGIVGSGIIELQTITVEEPYISGYHYTNLGNTVALMGNVVIPYQAIGDNVYSQIFAKKGKRYERLQFGSIVGEGIGNAAVYGNSIAYTEEGAYNDNLFISVRNESGWELVQTLTEDDLLPEGTNYDFGTAAEYIMTDNLLVTGCYPSYASNDVPVIAIFEKDTSKRNNPYVFLQSFDPQPNVLYGPTYYYGLRDMFLVDNMLVVSYAGDAFTPPAQACADIFYRPGPGERFSLFQNITQPNGNAEGNDYAFGDSVAGDKNTLFISEPNYSGGRVHVYEKHKTWELTQTITASDVVYGDYFGSGIYYDGDNTLIVSAPRQDVGEQEEAGVLYFFRKVNGTWTEWTHIDAPQSGSNGHFGGTLRGDGSIIYCRTYHSSDDQANSNGRLHIMELPYPAKDDVVIYNRERSGWEKYRIGMRGTTGMYLGRGQVALAGARIEYRCGDKLAYITDTGQLSHLHSIDGIFNRETVGKYIGDTKMEVTEIQRHPSGLPDMGPVSIIHDDISSGVLDISADRNLIAAGIPTHDTSKGEVLIFSVSEEYASGSVCESTITADDGSANDFFGYSVSLWGNLLAVGSPEYNSGAVDGGAVYVYCEHPDSPGTWMEEEIVMPGISYANARFGLSLAGSCDLLAVGEPFHDGTTSYGSGIVHVFERHFSNETGSGFWTDEQIITASDAEDGAMFGRAVDIDKDILVVGAPAATTDSSITGRAYVYRRNLLNREWTEEAVLDTTGVVPGGSIYSFGTSVSVSNNMIAVGSFAEDSLRGAVYVYKYDGSEWGLYSKLTYQSLEEKDSIQPGMGYGVNLKDGVLTVNGGNRTKIYIMKENGPELAASLEDLLGCFQQSASIGSMVYVSGITFPFTDYVGSLDMINIERHI